MQTDKVKIGSVYMAKLQGGLAPVQIREERRDGGAHKGWIGVNTLTNRIVKIPSAQRLRPMAPGEAANIGDVGPSAEAKTGASTATKGPVPPTGGSKARIPAKVGKKRATSSAKPPAKAVKSARAALAKKDGMSGLDAAAKILSETRKPMNCKVIVAEAFKRKLWRSEGATPEATIYAAIIREIAAKGDGARFKKVDRGQFAASKR